MKLQDLKGLGPKSRQWLDVAQGDKGCLLMEFEEYAGYQQMLDGDN